MTATALDRLPKSIVRGAVALGAACLLLAGGAWWIAHARAEHELALERMRAGWREKEFDRVKSGAASALVQDSTLLAWLGDDEDCRRVLEHLDFASVVIDPSDAQAVSQLKNVTSMTFYHTEGTKDVLVAAQALPITAIYFEGLDLRGEEHLVLKNFPQLKHVRFQHVMEDVWIERPKAELPNVVVDAPYPQSAEP